MIRKNSVKIVWALYVPNIEKLWEFRFQEKQILQEAVMWFNPMIIWLLKSPLHGFVSKNMMLVTMTGHKSGKQISTPTNYLRDGNTLWVVSWRERTWWRNLRGGAKVRVLLAGKGVEGRGQAIEEEKAVAQSLADYYQKVPQYAKYVKIGLDAAGLPVFADCKHAALKMVVIRIDLA